MGFLDKINTAKNRKIDAEKKINLYIKSSYNDCT